MANSNRTAAAGKAVSKPKKPRRDFPLTPRKDGRWAKKVGGKVHIFAGTAAQAEEEWDRVKAALYAGLATPEKKDGLTIEDVCDAFLTTKDNRLTTGHLAQRTYDEYKATCQRLGRVFGWRRTAAELGPADFGVLRNDIAKKWGPIRLGNEIQRVRSIFRFAYQQQLLKDEVRFGASFERPSAKVLRLERAKKGKRMFEAAEVLRLLHAAGLDMKAMILLGLNCGFGNADVGMLPLSALDLDGGWVTFPRPKTGVERRCKLWPETLKRLKMWITKRKEPKDELLRNRVFVTKYGKSWFKETPDNPISKEMRKLLDRLGMYRPGLGFYCLRHGMETVGGGAKDQPAVNHIMGHVDTTMAASYREYIDDERLQAVTDHVRRWLFKHGNKPKRVRREGGVA